MFAQFLKLLIESIVPDPFLGHADPLIRDPVPDPSI